MRPNKTRRIISILWLWSVAAVTIATSSSSSTAITLPTSSSSTVTRNETMELPRTGVDTQTPVDNTNFERIIARSLTRRTDAGDNVTEMNVVVATGRRKSTITTTATGANTMRSAIQAAALEGFHAMVDLYEKIEPEMFTNGQFLDPNDPGAKLSLFSAPNDDFGMGERAAYASLVAAKRLKQSISLDFFGIGRQVPPRVSLKRTPLEGLCAPRENPRCPPATRRYRTHDGTCNNPRRPRWGSAQMPFHRFLAPDYSDGIEAIRSTVGGGQMPSARFVSLVVHGDRNGESPVTLMLAQWGQFIDHDLTSTAQPRSFNGSVPRCCGNSVQHPSCFPIKVPNDDPWLAPLGVACLEFLRSAPAQRRDCLLSWREQTNQATSFLDASTVYSSNARQSDGSRIFRNGLLLFGRGPPREDVCLRGALANQCIRPGDSRSGEQPGLLAMHTTFVGEHNRIALELTDLNPHWSDEKVYQEARRIIGAMVQHITYREFLPLVLGREVCRLFDLELEPLGFYKKYDPRVNPEVGNSFAAAAFRFGHSLVQPSMMRCDRNHKFINNNVTLHEENGRGDIGGTGSLHRLLRGLVSQRAQRRDEFITAELTNHLFQSGSFPFGLDLAAINIQRGRDHGLPAYTSWRVPCGLTPVQSWRDIEQVVGPESAIRLQQAYRDVDDIDLFVGGLAERPVIGGLVGPTFACIIAQQFSNLRKGDRYWYENPGFESSFTPAQLQSIRQVSLAQIMCRTLGGGTLQPHVFLPADRAPNEREPCGLNSLAPIDLLPWTERDPFNKNVDQIVGDESVDVPQFFSSPSPSPSPSPSLSPSPPPQHQKLQPLVPPVPHPIVTTNKIINKVDFTPNGAVGVQIIRDPQVFTAKPFGEVSTTVTPSTTVVHNKLDLVPIKIVRPTLTRTKPTQTSASTTTGVSNKLDLTTLLKSKPSPIKVNHFKPTRPTAVSTLLKQTPAMNLTKNKTAPPTVTHPASVRLKRPTTKRPNKLKNNNNRRNDARTTIPVDEVSTLRKPVPTRSPFRNQDNATRFVNNEPVLFQGRAHQMFFYGTGPDAENQQIEDVSVWDPPYIRPITTTTSTTMATPTRPPNRPLIYQNNVPTYTHRPTDNDENDPVDFDTRNPYNRPNDDDSDDDTLTGPTKRPTNPYSHDAVVFVNGIGGNQRKPPLTEPGWIYRPIAVTTREPELQTFFLVETTRHTTTPTSPTDIHFFNNYSPPLSSHSAGLSVSSGSPTSLYSSPSSSSHSSSSLSSSMSSLSNSNANSSPSFSLVSVNSNIDEFTPSGVYINNRFSAGAPVFSSGSSVSTRKPPSSFFRPTANPLGPSFSHYGKRTARSVPTVFSYDTKIDKTDKKDKSTQTLHIATDFYIKNDNHDDNNNGPDYYNEHNDNDDMNDDYDATTYPPILNEQLNEDTTDTNATNSFDLDGYIRPEHMSYLPIVNKTKLNDDSLPDLNDNLTKKLRTINGDVGGGTRTHPVAMAHSRNAQQWRQSDAPIVPINVLTAPERPDHWIMYDVQNKKPLPSSPELVSATDFVSEIPRPMHPIRRKIAPNKINTAPASPKPSKL